MAKFWIDYSTSVLIEAETAEKAEELFWDGSYDELKRSEIQIDEIVKEEE